jgi:hypothetical protein
LTACFITCADAEGLHTILEDFPQLAWYFNEGFCTVAWSELVRSEKLEAAVRAHPSWTLAWPGFEDRIFAGMQMGHSQVMIGEKELEICDSRDASRAEIGQAERVWNEKAL